MFGLLLAFVPAAICAQNMTTRPLRGDVVVTTAGDTIVTTSVPSVQNRQVKTKSTDTPVTDLDTIIARAVRLGVQQAMAEQGIQSKIENRPRTKAEQLWDRSQKKRKIERVPRESLKATFVPKGQWMIGGPVNCSE